MLYDALHVPDAGNHSFWMVADDFARLRATFADVSGWFV